MTVKRWETYARKKIERMADQVDKRHVKRRYIETKFGAVIFNTFSVGVKRKTQGDEDAKRVLAAMVETVRTLIGSRRVRLYWRLHPSVEWVDYPADQEFNIPAWRGWKARCRVGFVDLDTKQPMVADNQEGKTMLMGEKCQASAP